MLNVILPEVLYENYYSEYLYCPIKSFHTVYNQLFQYNFENNVIESALSSFNIFMRTFEYSEDDYFFKSFYKTLIELNIFSDFIDFLKIYFNENDLKVNVNLVEFLSKKQNNYLISFDLPYLPSIPVIQKKYLSDYFLNDTSSYNLMSNFRPNGLGYFKKISELFKDFNNINIFVDLKNELNLKTFMKFRKVKFQGVLIPFIEEFNNA